MSEVIKLSYRGFGGLLALIFIFTFIVTSFALFISGIALVALAVYILIDPSILQTVTFSFGTGRVTDAMFGSILSFLSGLFIIVIGAGFLALTSFIWRYSIKLDKELTTFVEAKVPKTSVLVDRVKNPQTNLSPTDKISKLERLARLKEQGILTESEFMQEKQLILKEKD